MMAASDVSDLAAQIKALSPQDKLRLAADLFDAGKREMAHTIAEGVVLEWGAAMALDMLRRRDHA